MKLSVLLSTPLLAAVFSSTEAKVRGGKAERILDKSSGDTASSSHQLSEGQCEVCSKDNKIEPNSLTFEYIPEGLTSQFQGSTYTTCIEGIYPSSTSLVVSNKDGAAQSFDIEAGSIFTIDGPFSANTNFFFNQGSASFSCDMHTSCSVPLVTGDQLGPFKLVAGNECDINSPSNSTDVVSSNLTLNGHCEICSQDNKNKPDSLTLQYMVDGKNSLYQDSDKASCVAGTYPSTTTVFTGNQIWEVSDGTVFTIEGPLSAETDFTFADGSECYIHTSCSVPLVAGDQIGPFLVLEGNECKYEDPTPSPTMNPTPGPTPRPTTPKPTPGPSSDPTPGPTTDPTAAPTKKPSPSPTNSPTNKPTPSPVPVPTRSPTTETPTNSPTPIPPVVSGLIVRTPSPTTRPTSGPTPDPTPAPTSGPTPGPTPESTPAPTEKPTFEPTRKPTDEPTKKPTEEPTKKPTPAPTKPPTIAPTRTPCLQADKASYQCGEAIDVSFHFDDPLDSDWVGIYPCDESVYYHAEVWKWTCPGFPANCTGPVSSGNLTFDSLPSYNSASPAMWPIAPFLHKNGGSVIRCFKAVLLRNDGPSVPPYVDICESDSFTITENDEPGCAIRAVGISDGY